MAVKSAKADLVAGRYGVVFLEMAEEAGITDAVEKDCAALSAMMESSEDLRRMISSPLLNRRQQQAAILALAEKAGFCKLAANFLGVCAANRRLSSLPAIIAAFRAEKRRRSGGVEAKVETAVPLTKAQTEALKAELAKSAGGDVALDVTVNESLLGGMIVTVGSRMIDDSVRRKLERLQRAMSGDAKAA